MPRDAERHRTARLARKTRETDISVVLDLDGEGKGDIATGVPFFDHMLTLLARHALFDLKVCAKGDLEIDDHHTLEDVGLALGTAFARALGDKKGIARYGFSLLPMDETLARVAVDLSGRPFFVYDLATKEKRIKDFETCNIEEFLRAFAFEAKMNLHVSQLYGKNAHHAFESIFKALAKALKMACARDPRVKGVPSSKGVL